MASDDDLKKRFEKLKCDNVKHRDLPTEEELVKRLTNLTGRDVIPKEISEHKKILNVNEFNDHDLNSLLNDKILLDDLDILYQKDYQLQTPNTPLPTEAISPKSKRYVDFTDLVLVSPKLATQPIDQEAIKLIEEAQEEVRLEKKYGEINNDEAFEERFNNLFKNDDTLSAVDTKVKKKVSLKNLGRPPKAPDVKDFLEENEDCSSWCCICNEDADVRCEDCDDGNYIKNLSET
ncbi:hypothetical protein HK099_006714 [Clydaea vesicula]|uniref:Uncharacterized protein n=1 Tax=Clydaea vesicula TaxID=447962 RepID=A0AAD5U897_9FUNG|nr:hypothetical protein HK099_006714 [Clydaea vesicula]